MAFVVFASLIVTPASSPVPDADQGVQLTAWVCDLDALAPTTLHSI